VRFTQFYNTARCWSSRASLLTGYYPQAIRRDLLPDEDRGEYGMFGKVAGANGVRPRWAQALPAYLRRLNAEPRFRGRSFAQLQLKAATEGGVPVTEFTLRSSGTAPPVVAAR
jgi:hypothetical protein